MIPSMLDLIIIQMLHKGTPLGLKTMYVDIGDLVKQKILLLKHYQMDDKEGIEENGKALVMLLNIEIQL